MDLYGLSRVAMSRAPRLRDSPISSNPTVLPDTNHAGRDKPSRMVIEGPALHPHGIAQFAVSYAGRPLHEPKESRPRFSEGRGVRFPIRGKVESDLVAVTTGPHGAGLPQGSKMMPQNPIAQFGAAT